MADFVQKTVNKTAVRDLAVPIADVTSFDNLIETIIEDNPFGCVGYTAKAIAPVIRNREHYTARVNFVNSAGQAVGHENTFCDPKILLWIADDPQPLP